MRQLSVYFFGNRTFLQHNRDGIVCLRQGRNENVDIATADSRCGNVDFITIDGRVIAQRIGDESQNGGVGRKKVREARAQQRSAPHVEEGLGRCVDVDHHALHVDREQRLGERVQHFRGVRTPLSRVRGHAACLASSRSKASGEQAPGVSHVLAGHQFTPKRLVSSGLFGVGREMFSRMAKSGARPRAC